MFLQIMRMEDNYLKQPKPSKQKLPICITKPNFPKIKVHIVQHPHFCNGLSVKMQSTELS
jgi:hypothetical protein